MKKHLPISLMMALALGLIAPQVSQAQSRAEIEHELAITAYNYAVGCSERQRYDQALTGLSNIPAGQLTSYQQSLADSLRIKCEVLSGRQVTVSTLSAPVAAVSSASASSAAASAALDSQSELFLRGIESYKSGQYTTAIQRFTEAINMGQGQREQVGIEAIFWRGQCRYQLKQWEECCKDLILFNDTKNERTHLQCDALAYYTMGYARMQVKKYHHARINFERYLGRQTDTSLPSFLDAQERLNECAQLERGLTTSYRLPLAPEKVQPTMGQAAAVTAAAAAATSTPAVAPAPSRSVVSTTAPQAVNTDPDFWRQWHAPYIQ